MEMQSMFFLFSLFLLNMNWWASPAKTAVPRKSSPWLQGTLGRLRWWKYRARKHGCRCRIEIRNATSLTGIRGRQWGWVSPTHGHWNFADTFPAYVKGSISDSEIAEDSPSLSPAIQQEKGHFDDCSNELLLELRGDLSALREMRDKLQSANEDIQDLCRKLKQGELDVDVFRLAPEEFTNPTIDLTVEPPQW